MSTSMSKSHSTVDFDQLLPKDVIARGYEWTVVTFNYRHVSERQDSSQPRSPNLTRWTLRWPFDFARIQVRKATMVDIQTISCNLKREIDRNDGTCTGDIRY